MKCVYVCVLTFISVTLLNLSIPLGFDGLQGILYVRAYNLTTVKLAGSFVLCSTLDVLYLFALPNYPGKIMLDRSGEHRTLVLFHISEGTISTFSHKSLKVGYAV